MTPIEEPSQGSTQPNEATPPEESEQAFQHYSVELTAAIDRDVRAWLTMSVRSRIPTDRWSAELDTTVEQMAESTHREILSELATLLSQDLDDQRDTPLGVLRRAAIPATELLAAQQIPPLQRDEFERKADPYDHYGIAPKTWSDVSETVGSAGIAWGAAKAYVHLQRRNSKNNR